MMERRASGLWQWGRCACGQPGRLSRPRVASDTLQSPATVRQQPRYFALTLPRFPLCRTFVVSPQLSRRSNRREFLTHADRVVGQVREMRRLVWSILAAPGALTHPGMRSEAGLA